MLWIILAIALDRVQLKLTSHAYKQSAYRSGYAAIDSVNQRKAFMPMAYRVLVPWLVWVIERLGGKGKYRFEWVYELIKIGLMALALWSASLAIGVAGAVVLGIMLCMTFWSDYWDTYVEIAALAMAMTGNIGLAVVGTVLLGLSRETAPMVGIVYGLSTGRVGESIQLVALSCAVLLAVRLHVGRKKLYCERWMLKQNWQDLLELLHNKPIYLCEMFMTLIVTVLTIVAIFGRPVAWPVPAILLVAGWLMARAPETRVFASCYLWIAPLILRWS